MTALVIGLCVLLVLNDLNYNLGFFSDEDDELGWTSLMLESSIQWLPWLLGAPLVALVGLRWRIGRTHPGLLLGVVLGFAVAVGALLASVQFGLETTFEEQLHPPLTEEELAELGWIPDEDTERATSAGGGADDSTEGAELGEDPFFVDGEHEHEVFTSARMVVSVGIAHAFSFVVFSTIVQIFLVYRDLRRRESTTSLLRAELLQAQLSTMRMQLQPHFLFNALNSINVLIDEDPAAAQTMLHRLSDLLRETFRDLEKQEVPLERELHLLERYLGIERVRFGDSLLVNIEVDPSMKGAMVPAFCLQPLVENAIRHALGQREGAVKIHVRGRRENSTLVLEVEDDGPGVPTTESVPEGVGLLTTRSRLDALYGERGAMALENASRGGLRVRLRLPLHTEAALH